MSKNHRQWHFYYNRKSGIEFAEAKKQLSTMLDELLAQNPHFGDYSARSTKIESSHLAWGAIRMELLLTENVSALFFGSLKHQLQKVSQWKIKYATVKPYDGCTLNRRSLDWEDPATIVCNMQDLPKRMEQEW